MEMEVTNLGLSGNNQPVKELLDSYANNSTMRKELIEQLLTTNPFDPEVEFSEDKDSNNNLKILNSFLTALGIEIINNKNVSNISHMYNEEYKPNENINTGEYEKFIKSKLFNEEETDSSQSEIDDFDDESDVEIEDNVDLSDDLQEDSNEE